jgi:hypothetical protein
MSHGDTLRHGVPNIADINQIRFPDDQHRLLRRPETPFTETLHFYDLIADDCFQA